MTFYVTLSKDNNYCAIFENDLIRKEYGQQSLKR